MRTVPRVALYAVFLSLFVAVSISNFVLRRQLNEARTLLRTAAAPASRRFKVGDAIPGFEVRDRAKNVVTVGGTSPSNANRILALVHPQCKHCLKLLDEIARTPNVAANLAVVSLTTPAKSTEVTRRMPAAIPTYYVEQVMRSPIAAHVGVVPQLLIVGANGKVAEVCSTLQECEEHSRQCANCAVTAAALR